MKKEVTPVSGILRIISMIVLIGGWALIGIAFIAGLILSHGEWMIILITFGGSIAGVILIFLMFIFMRAFVNITLNCEVSLYEKEYLKSDNITQFSEVKHNNVVYLENHSANTGNSTNTVPVSNNGNFKPAQTKHTYISYVGGNNKSNTPAPISQDAYKMYLINKKKKEKLEELEKSFERGEITEEEYKKEKNKY